MLSLCRKALVGVATVNAWNTGNEAGAGISLTKAGAQNAKNVIAPYLFGFLQDLKIPKISFKGGNLQNLEIAISQPPV